MAAFRCGATPWRRKERIVDGNDGSVRSMIDLRRRFAAEPAPALRLALLGLGLAAVLVPMAFLGLALARALGVILLAAALAVVLLPGWPRPRYLAAAGLAGGGLVLLLHPLEGMVSPPTVVMVTLGWMALAAAWIAVRDRNDAASIAAVGPMVMVFLILTGWVCGRFWLLATFVGVGLWLAARVVGAALPVSRAAPRPAPPAAPRSRPSPGARN
jgi:hypothetical protein